MSDGFDMGEAVVRCYERALSAAEKTGWTPSAVLFDIRQMCVKEGAKVEVEICDGALAMIRLDKSLNPRRPYRELGL